MIYDVNVSNIYIWRTVRDLLSITIYYCFVICEKSKKIVRSSLFIVMVSTVEEKITID